MDVDGVIKLARELIEQNPDNLYSHLIDEYLSHLSDTYRIAGETVDAVCSRYPWLEKYINREEVALAGGLHDIGRPLRKNQLFHELRGARYIEDHGLEMGVGDSLVDVYRIAQMFRSHYLVAEQFDDRKNGPDRGEFETLDPELLIPRSWQEAIVVYAELSNIRGTKISNQDRIADIKKRYADDPLYNSNASLLRAMDKGLPRILETCERVERLKCGRLGEPEIMRYGFI